MHKTRRRYHESLLQWIWKHLEFDTRSIHTCCRKAMRIEDPGEQNPGAGPDFLNARIQIDDLLWHGHIEIHRDENDWYTHSHHTNPEFNGVILHVFLQRSDKRARRCDGTALFGFHLSPFLEKPLYHLLQRKQRAGLLPCAGLHQNITHEIFSSQIRKARGEYFEYKKNELIRFYPHDMTFPKAWKISFITGLYSALGIPRNRQAMIQTAQSVCKNPSMPKSRNRFIQSIIESADVDNRGKWHHTGMRPPARPDRRILQAAHLHYTIHHTAVVNFLKRDTAMWSHFMESQENAFLPGSEMRGILHTTVFLPALHFLGDLVDSNSIKNKSLETWNAIKSELPRSIYRPFEKSGLPLQNHMGDTGLVHQLKRYCRTGQCHRCEVFKMAIRS